MSPAQRVRELLGLFQQSLPPLCKLDQNSSATSHPGATPPLPENPNSPHLTVDLLLQGGKRHAQQVQLATATPPGVTERALWGKTGSSHSLLVMGLPQLPPSGAPCGIP